MGQFSIAYKITGGHEGGYANDEKDRGGETYKGIARKKNPTWPGWIYVDAMKTKPGFPENLEGNKDIQRLIPLFYKEQYWDINKLDEINDQRICNEMYDTGVHVGTGQAALYLQRVLNVSNRNQLDFPDLELDGKIGPITVKRVNQHKNIDNVYRGLNVLQGYKYFSICEANAEQEKYYNGWMKRVFEG